METIYVFFNFIEKNLIHCLVPIVLTLILSELIFKKKSVFPYKIVSWIVLIFTFYTFLKLIFEYSFWDGIEDVQNHAFGKYWLAFWMVNICLYLLPLTLLHQKLSIHKYYVLMVVIILQLPFLTEFLSILQMHSSLHFYKNEKINFWESVIFQYLWICLLQGIILGILLYGMVVGRIAKK